MWFKKSSIGTRVIGGDHNGTMANGIIIPEVGQLCISTPAKRCVFLEGIFDEINGALAFRLKDLIPGMIIVY